MHVDVDHDRDDATDGGDDGGDGDEATWMDDIND